MNTREKAVVKSEPCEVTNLPNLLFIGQIKRGLEIAAALCPQPGLFSHELHSGPGLNINLISSSYLLDIFPTS